MIKVTVKAEGKAPSVRMFSDQKGADWFVRTLLATARKHGITIESLDNNGWKVI